MRDNIPFVKRLPFLSVLLLLALLARVAIPAGFMPDFDKGKLAITICHGAELATILVDADDTPGQTAKETCPFIPIAGQAPSLDGPVLAYAPVRYEAFSYTPAQQSVEPSRAFEPGRPRAPPFSL